MGALFVAHLKISKAQVVSDFLWSFVFASRDYQKKNIHTVS